MTLDKSPALGGCSVISCEVEVMTPRLHRTVLRLALGILCACLGKVVLAPCWAPKGCLVTEFSPLSSKSKSPAIPRGWLWLLCVCIREDGSDTVLGSKGLLVAEFSPLCQLIQVPSLSFPVAPHLVTCVTCGPSRVGTWVGAWTLSSP